MWSGRPNGRLLAKVATSPRPGTRRRLWRRRRRDLARPESLDGHRHRYLRSRVEPGARGRRIGRAAVSGSAGTPFSHRSRLARSTSFRCSTRRCPRPLAKPPRGGSRHGVPRGLLLAVFHDLDDERHGHMKPRGVDPADYVGADDSSSCSAMTSVELHGVEPRMDPPQTTRTSPTSSCGFDAAEPRTSDRSATSTVFTRRALNRRWGAAAVLVVACSASLFCASLIGTFGRISGGDGAEHRVQPHHRRPMNQAPATRPPARASVA